MAEYKAQLADFLCEHFSRFIDDEFAESNWRSTIENLYDLQERYSTIRYEFMNYVDLQNCVQIDYVKQLIRRQQHKNEHFLREYANFMVSSTFFSRHLFTNEPIIYASVISFFVVELMYKCTNPDLIKENDPIFLRGETLQNIILNIVNTKFPFEYLKWVFYASLEKETYFSLVARFMERELCLGPINVHNNHPYEEVEHLLAFVHKMWVNSSEFGRAMFVKIGKRTGPQQVIQNATELQRAGIRFKGVKKPTFDIRFQQGLLEIPVLSIITETCSFLQNFIAYEKESPGNAMLIVSDYCVVMDCLIQSPQDVQLLRESGVIESYLHDDKDVVTMFDKLGKRVPSSTHFCYSDLFDKVNKHCVQTWNSWKAKFRRNYFREDNQLEALSFMFAIYIILPVTILQTVYTILSYYKGGG